MFDQGSPCQARRPVITTFLPPSWSMERHSFYKLIDSIFCTFNSSFIFFLQLSLLALSCNAQSNAYFWGFSNNFVSTSLSECQSLGIYLIDNNHSVSFGTPPYYMMALEVGGIPTTEYIGEDPTALNWVVNHAAGSTLVLSVVDAIGDGGGIPPNVYTVIPGVDPSCLPDPPTSNFTVSANVTGTLSTCQPWGMTILGGVPPYSVTLVSLNSPDITNATLGPLDNAFTYIDRAMPNTQLIAAISDSTGTFASGTPIVHTQGSSDASCLGLVSSSGNATTIQAEDAAFSSAGTSQARKHTAVVIAVGIILLLVLFTAGTAFAHYQIRRRRGVDNEEGSGKDPEFKRIEQIGGPLEITPSLAVEPSSRSVSLYSQSPRSMKERIHDSSPPPSRADNTRESGSHYPSRFPSSRPLPTPINKGRSRQLRLVGELRRAETALPSGPRNQSLPNRSLSAGAPLLPRDSVEPDIIIQHRDGGIVQELPPPYLDRTSRSGRL